MQKKNLAYGQWRAFPPPTGVGDEGGMQTQVCLCDKPWGDEGLLSMPKSLPFNPAFPGNYPTVTLHAVQDDSFNIVYSSNKTKLN